MFMKNYKYLTMLAVLSLINAPYGIASDKNSDESNSNLQQSDQQASGRLGNFFNNAVMLRPLDATGSLVTGDNELSHLKTRLNRRRQQNNNKQQYGKQHTGYGATNLDPVNNKGNSPQENSRYASEQDQMRDASNDTSNK